MDRPVDNLLAAANELCQVPAFRQVIWRHCALIDETVDIRRLNTRIHPNDQMLQHSLNGLGEANRAVSQYFNVALQQHSIVQQILKLFFDVPKSRLDILDFACGYGRLLRFLTLTVPPSHIWASDIQRDAVDFVAREFGVNGIYSGFVPEQFEPGRKFDVIWVASLFSHLPDHLFRGWLAKLVSLLKPGGALCFSVHDERLLPQEISMPDDGIYFNSASENADLDKSIYGTTFVSESFVRNAIFETAGNNHPFFRVKRGLANQQDIYIVPKEQDQNLDRLAQLRSGAWGWVDVCRISAGDLILSGWATSMDDGEIDSVQITVNERNYSCSTGVVRDDVRRTLGDDRLLSSGWEIRLPLGMEVPVVFLEVTAKSGRNEMALLYAGTLASGTPAPVWRPRSMSFLMWLRSRRTLVWLARHLPMSWQRRIKSRLHS